ncbi:NAD(P)H-dependent flavin oxidoreductase YrpB (nitropropane dioxygenase family) [Marinitoga litoralis]|nr:nitronate monooxygenase family protein [Marinitoga litoralis]MBM7559178.1 NAD(P)H-dependent flavin oxidoreductase YrpB (nitropropane dioxygenase family) [Marinitoga litoralis]
MTIGNLEIKYPIVQGGMAVGISLDNLAAAVANAGGIGVIGTAGIGLFSEIKNYREASISGLKKIIRKAKEKTNGIIGVNIMVALTNYGDMVKTAIDENIDIIFSGAGLPLSSPSFLKKESKTKLVPIVSSLKAAQIIVKRWISKFNYIPDAFVLEGPLAGGHLGYKKDELFSEKNKLERNIPLLKEYLLNVEKKYGKKIPLIAGGGLYSKEDVEKVLGLGADAVQMGTRFIATEECDANIKFKEAIIKAKDEDITIIKSPVGLPGRALKNSFIESVEKGDKKPYECRYHCIKTCDFKDAPYCIAKALYNAAIGNLEEGFVFTGKSVSKINRIQKVEDIFNELFEN